MKLTAKETKAVKALNRAAGIWPDSLWLFSADGMLCVMKKMPDGRRGITRFGGVDQDYIVSTVAIDNDGGDW